MPDGPIRILSSNEDSSVHLIRRGDLICVAKSGPRLDEEARALEHLAGAAGLPRLLAYDGQQLVRTFLPGRTLQSLVRRRHWTSDHFRVWLQRLRLRLDQLHEQGVWHGDVCPANIVIDSSDEVFLIDWGGRDWGTPPYRQPGIHGPAADRLAWQRLANQWGSQDPGSGRKPQRLYGRENQLRSLRAYWDQAGHSESTWVGVAAESGAGKTALLEELRGWTGHAVLARATTLTTPAGYQLFQSILEQAGWVLPSLERSAPGWKQFETTFRQRLTERDTAAHVPWLLLEAWTELLTQVCQRCPLLLLLDDLQWVDGQSLQLLEQLSQAPIPGLMVVLAWRSQEWEPGSHLPLRQILTLPPLDEQALRAWAGDRPFREMLNWTRGQPLLVEEWLRSPQAPEFSGRVGGLVQARLQNAPENYLRVLQRAALMGVSFRPEPLAALPEAEAALHWAERQQLLLPGPRFSHDSVREGLLEQIGHRRVAEEHLALARWHQDSDQDPRACAFHFSQAGESSLAAPYALAAARQEKARGAPEAAAYFYQLCFVVQPRPDLAHEYSEVLELLTRHERAVEMLRLCLEQPDSRGWHCEIRLRLSRHLYFLSQPEALEQAQRALALRKWALRPERTDPARVFDALVETTFMLTDKRKLAHVLLLSLPYWVSALGQNSVAGFHLAIAWHYFFRLPLPGWMRGQLLRLNRRASDRLLKARMNSRRLVRCFDSGPLDGRAHVRALRHLGQEFESLGQLWESAMVSMQLGLWAMARGDFPELLQQAGRLRRIDGLGGHADARFLALHFEVMASGGRVSPRALQHEVLERSLLRLHRDLARARFFCFQGEYAQAWTELATIRTFVPLEVSLYQVLRAQVARRWAQATPRRWKQLAQNRWQLARKAARAVIGAGSFGRLWRADALRELAFCEAAAGRPDKAHRLLDESLAWAQKGRFRYQEALTHQALARLGYPSRGDQMLVELGAWWDLSASHQPVGLPARQLVEAACQYLQHQQGALAELAPPDWFGRLEGQLAQAQQAQAQVKQSLQRLEQENMRWQSFLAEGPLRQGGSSQPAVMREWLSIDGELIEVWLPEARHHYSELLALVEVEKARLLSHWTRLGLVPTTSGLPDCLIPGSETIPWELLSQPVQLSLRKILGEAAQNNRHAAHPGQLRVELCGDHLRIQWFYAPAESARPDIPWERFGLSSMTFRARLVGGQLDFDAHYGFCLRLPLQPKLA